MRTHKWTNIHMHEAEKFGPDNRESQANLKRVLSLTFQPLFQGEIRILKEANYQSQERGGEEFEETYVVKKKNKKKNRFI